MQRKILVIDKSAELLEVIKFLLEEEGFDVDTTSNIEILSELKTIKPNLLLIEESLFGNQTIEICRSIKSNIQTQNISIILSSNNIDIAEINKNARTDGYIKKPFEITELVDVIKSTMQINNNFEKKDREFD
ncbi:MAG: response regulator [Pedobacter sp.]|nr:MAG: response regulator [Pedobacter sp.]